MDGDVGPMASPFADVDAQEQPIEEQLEKNFMFVQEHAKKLHEMEDAVNSTLAEAWDTADDPVYMHLQPPEKVDVQDLFTTDNELFNKVLTVLAVLCDEISEIKVTAQSNFYPAMIMFGQAKHGAEDVDLREGEEEQQMGRMLPFFQDLSNLVDRCNSIAVNVVHQLASLYHPMQKLWKTTFKHVHLMPVYDSLGSLLEVLITLDAIVLDNPAIGAAWDQYKRMMQFVRAEPSRYGIDEERVRQFERLLVSLDQNVMSGAILSACVEQDFEAPPSEDDQFEVHVRSNKVFLEEMFYCIRDRFQVAANAIGTPTETNQRVQLVGVFGLYVLYRRLTPPNVLPDAKFYRKLWAVQKKVPLVTLCTRVVWYASDFLLRHAPFATKKLEPKDVPAFRRDHVKRLDENFPREVQACYLQSCAWLVGMESHITPASGASGDPHRLMQLRGQLLLTGQLLAIRISNIVHTMMNLHLSLEVPLRKTSIAPLRECIEMLKAIERMFVRKSAVIGATMAMITKQYAASLHAIFRPLQAKLEASKRFDDTKLDILAAVTVMDATLRGSESMSPTRQTVVALALRVVLISNMVKEAQAEDALSKLWKLTLCADWQRQLREACDCTFLYWSRELLPAFVGEIWDDNQRAPRLPYVLSAFSDCKALLSAAQHEADHSVFRAAYAKYVEDTVAEELITPLCAAIENDLRLHVHSVHLEHLAAPNPKRGLGGDGARTFGRYLSLPPIRLFGSELLHIRGRVQHYLEQTFYNLTTVALHDWKTYGEMKNLACEKYGLALAEAHLPMGSLDQGLDVLQIMRNIHVFVGRYNYNLNQQTFLERKADRGSKNLNAISVHSISSSIRTHGLGMMNTTVNYTFHFLSKKFNIFSQFLFDEYIKSYLARESRWFKKHKDSEQVDQRYPYDHAFQFNKDIRKLGVAKDGKSYMDQFRILITEVGNALGYVRMVRSAGMHYCSKAVRYIPDLDDIPKFEDLLAGTGGGDGGDAEDESKAAAAAAPVGSGPAAEATVRSARNLDKVLENLMKQFSDGVDYFKILVNVFRKSMASIEHLKNFHMIVPALCINFVESSLQAKDLMYKSHRNKESYFSDDGFAMGVAYILAILDQGSSFDTLHWFETVTLKHETDKAELLVSGGVPRSIDRSRPRPQRSRDRDRRRPDGPLTTLPPLAPLMPPPPPPWPSLPTETAAVGTAAQAAEEARKERGGGRSAHAADDAEAHAAAQARIRHAVFLAQWRAHLFQGGGRR